MGITCFKILPHHPSSNSYPRNVLTDEHELSLPAGEGALPQLPRSRHVSSEESACNLIYQSNLKFTATTTCLLEFPKTQSNIVNTSWDAINMVCQDGAKLGSQCCGELQGLRWTPKPLEKCWSMNQMCTAVRSDTSALLEVRGVGHLSRRKALLRYRDTADDQQSQAIGRSQASHMLRKQNILGLEQGKDMNLPPVSVIFLS